MKKVIFMLTTLVFFTLCLNTVYADENYIDIGIYYGNSAKSEVTLTCYGNKIQVKASDISEEALYDSDGLVAIDGKEYSGSVVLKKNSNGLLTVINRVNLENYIASVISSEMSSSFNIEALKAQAVCARTYAIRNKGKHKSYGFDLCASTDCQAYGGTSTVSAPTALAAEETAGCVITYNGDIIDAVYSATSGGYTEDVVNVWGSEIPYLKAVEDPYESKNSYGSSWTRELTVEEATEVMNKKGYNLGTITDITVVSKTIYGTVTELKVTGTEGEKTFKREGCRLAFGNTTLSQAFTVTAKSDEKDTSRKLYAYDGEGMSDNPYVISANGKEKITLDKVFLLGNTKINYEKTSKGPVSSFVFNGRGFGHLVGMSQNGANGMAAAGFSYEEILKHYYKGIELNWI